MTPKQQYITEQTERCRKEWFKEHKASIVTGTPDVTLIGWENPKSWNYGCRFIIHRRWLTVVGDIGEAVFEWSQNITLEFMLQINFHYFMGKCQASPEGRKFESFDANVAEQYRKERVKELTETLDEDKSEGDAKELEVLTENTQCGADEFREAAREYYDATGDAEGASSISDMGMVPSCHAIGMFVGLQMALTQLKEAKV